MKLIRISSDDDSAIFETQFNENINVKPMSKIALSSFSGNVKPIQLQTFSDQITFNIDWATSNLLATVNITNGIYNRNNFFDLLDQITNGFNSKLVYNNTTNDENLLGGQWRATVIDKRVSIHYEIGYNDSDLDNFQVASTLNNTSDILGMNTSEASTPLYSNSATSKYNVSMGNGYLRAQIYNLVNDTSAPAGFIQQGFILGFSKTVLPDSIPGNFAQSNIDFGLGIGWNGSGFEFYIQQGSTIAGLGVNPVFNSIGDTSNSFVEVMVNGSKVQCYYTNLANTRVLLTEFAHNSADKLWGFYCFHSNKNFASLKYYEWTTDPFNNPTTSHNRDATNPNNLYINPNNYTVKSLAFDDESPEFPKFLGYKVENDQAGLLILESPNTRGGYNFIGNNLFYPSINNRSFILELLSNNLESYDSTQKQRKSILSSVLSSNQIDVIEKEPNIIFIDLNNKNELDMRNIRMRLVDTDYNNVELVGKSVATILIADENEKSF